MHSEGRWGIERGCVGRWLLQSDAVDTIGTNDGTLNGGMGFGSAGGRSCAVFDGTDDSISTGNVSYTSGNPFTIACWARRTGVGYYMTMVSQSSYPDEGVSMFLDEGAHENEISFVIGAGVYPYRNSGVVMSVDTWYHIALTFDGTTNRFYVNGTESVTSTDVRPSRTLPYRIGRWYDNLTTTEWLGNVSIVRDYNRALNAAEIARLARIY